MIWLSVALAFLWAAVPSRPQDPPLPGEASEALVEPEDGVERLHEANDARVPPDAFLFPMAAAPAASGDYRIDALLSPYKWNVPTVTYSFYRQCFSWQLLPWSYRDWSARGERGRQGQRPANPGLVRHVDEHELCGGGGRRRTTSA